jgi:hypothetical protein
MMAKLTKYQLKQLSPAEQIDYEDGNLNVDANITRYDGGYVKINQEDDMTWTITIYDDNDFECETDWRDTRHEAMDCVEAMIEEIEMWS